MICFYLNRSFDFNPRPPAEGDAFGSFPALYVYPISIHALPRRATADAINWATTDTISIHALPRRATFPAESPYIHRCISIHALPRRATRAAELL